MQTPRQGASSPTLLIFFKRYRDRRDLHSFPTRRSSDLALRRALLVDRRADHVPETAQRDRSEEHTPELQSRENLVCRLLHEKKKRIAIRPLANLRVVYAGVRE